MVLQQRQCGELAQCQARCQLCGCVARWRCSNHLTCRCFPMPPLSASQRYQIANRLPTRLRYGLTGTPFQNDYAGALPAGHVFRCCCGDVSRPQLAGPVLALPPRCFVARQLAPAACVHLTHPWLIPCRPRPVDCISPTPTPALIRDLQRHGLLCPRLPGPQEGVQPGGGPCMHGRADGGLSHRLLPWTF